MLTTSKRPVIFTGDLFHVKENYEDVSPLAIVQQEVKSLDTLHVCRVYLRVREHTITARRPKQTGEADLLNHVRQDGLREIIRKLWLCCSRKVAPHSSSDAKRLLQVMV